MTEKEVTVLNRAGIHARPATRIVETANSYKSEVFISREENKINAKSIMGILTLGASYKSRLIISAEGADEEEAVSSLAALFENRFEE